MLPIEEAPLAIDMELVVVAAVVAFVSQFVLADAFSADSLGHLFAGFRDLGEALLAAEYIPDYV